MAISWLIACGIHAKMESDIQARLPVSWTMPTNIKLVPLSLDNLIMPFFIFLGGVSMAIIAFLIERVNHKRKFVCPPSKSVNDWRGIGPRAKHAWTNVGNIRRVIGMEQKFIRLPKILQRTGDDQYAYGNRLSNDD